MGGMYSTSNDLWRTNLGLNEVECGSIKDYSKSYEAEHTRHNMEIQNSKLSNKQKTDLKDIGQVMKKLKWGYAIDKHV